MEEVYLVITVKMITGSTDVGCQRVIGDSIDEGSPIGRCRCDFRSETLDTCGAKWFHDVELGYYGRLPWMVQSLVGTCMVDMY